MAALILLILLNAIMAIITLAAGYASIKFSVSPSRMSKVTALSTGILIGTALGVILPEGVLTILEAQETLARFESFGLPPSFIIGASLLLGFIVLYVTEYLLSSRESSGQEGLSDLRRMRLFWSIFHSILKSPLTLGLIVHSFVDGIALGTSFLDENKAFQFLFFFMIVIHKIPTAFSLAVILLKEEISHSMVKFHILAFALATPLASILTYFIALLFGMKSPFVLGILLLFSAGTFLFSVLHVMKENSDPSNGQPAIASVQLSPFESHDAAQASKTDLLLTVAGMLLPLFFSLTGAD